VRRRLLDTAAHLTGARVLTARLYGAGPITALALTCWLGGKDRFSSARKAVRFAGLDVTVYSSAGKRSPGHLSGRDRGAALVRVRGRQGPRPRIRPDHAYYAQVKDRIDGKRGRHLRGSQDHPAGLPHPVRARRRRARHVVTHKPVTSRDAPVPPGHGKRRPHSPDGGTTAASSRHQAVSRYPAAQGTRTASKD